jgi:hypothetical protein
MEQRIMTERKEQFDEDMDLRIPSKLSTDLRALFEPQVGIPPEVDRAVMDQAHKHLTPLQSRKARRSCIHWGWRIAAAAAIVILAFSLDLTKQSGPSTDSLTSSKTQAVDIDQNGRVDILDAFKLARHIETDDRTEKEWDFNGDGLINRSDVDIVANLAVRLNKGV